MLFFFILGRHETFNGRIGQRESESSIGVGRGVETSIVRERRFAKGVGSRSKRLERLETRKRTMGDFQVGLRTNDRSNESANAFDSI